MTPQDTLRQAILNDEFPDDSTNDRLLIPTGEDALKLNRNIAVSAWMSQASKSDINAGSTTWQAEKDALAQGFFKMPNAKDVTDETVHDLIRSHIQTSDSATSIALNSALSGRSFSQTLNEVQSFTGVSKTRGIRDRYVNEASNLYGNVAARVAPYRAMINNVAGTLSKEMESALPTTDAFQKAADALLLVPVEDRALVINAIGKTGGATAEERASYLSKLAGAMGRITETIGASVVGSMTEAAFAESAASLREAGNFGFASAMEGEADKQGQYRILTQMIRQTADSEINPIKGDGWLGQLGIDVARMVPQTAITVANPAIGFAANLSYFQDTQSAQAMMEDSSLTYKQAQAITALSAPISAAAETITALIPFGKVKLPFFSKWIQATTTSTGAALRNLGVRAATGTAGEITEEYVQSAAPLISQELLGVLSADMPDVDWENRMPDFSKVAAETWAPALVFSLIGAGATSISDIKSGRKLASDLDLMVASGVNVELAGKIKTESDAGNWSQVDGLFREEFVSKAKASAPDIQAATDRLKARFRDQLSMDVLQDATSPEYTAKVIRTSAGWQVQTGDGNVITTETKEAADQIYNNIRQVGNQKEAEVMAEILDGYYASGMGKGAQVEMTGETVGAAGDVVSAIRRDASGAPIAGSARVFDERALEEVRAEAAAAGFASDTQEVFARINGSNEVFPQQVGDTTKGIWRILSLFESRKNATPQVATLLHEDIESKFTLGLINKSWTVGDIQKAFAGLLPAFANITAPIVQTNEQIAKMSKSAQEAYYAKQSEFNWISNVRKIVAGDYDAAMLRETFSEMYVRDRFALDRKGLPTGLPAGSISRGIEASIMGATTQEEAGVYKRFRAMFKAFSAHFKAVFKTVQTMVAARKEGKIGEDWDTFINKVLGIDEVKQMESQAVEEGKAMLGVDAETQAVTDAGNMAFSTSRAQPADTSNITEMPDGAQIVGPTTFSITAYHGTAHKVDEFRLDKIGTGEGAQTYGWGLYFAGNAKTADVYRRSVSGKHKTGSGNLYTVELLPDEEDFLDWDKPLSEHPQKIQDKLFVEFGKLYNKMQTGGEWYQGLVKDDTDPKTLSEDLARIGIPGLRYLDSGSRLNFRLEYTAGKIRVVNDLTGKYVGPSFEQGDEVSAKAYAKMMYDAMPKTRNYVIFDESLVKILEENGQRVEGQTFSISPPYKDRSGEDAGSPLTDTEIREGIEDEQGTQIESPIEIAELGEVLDDPSLPDIPWGNTMSSFSVSPVLSPWKQLTRDDLKKAGKKAFAFYADRMRVGTYSGIDPNSGIEIPLQGGFNYPAQKEMIENDIAWAVSDEKTVKSMITSAKRTGGNAIIALFSRGNVTGNATFLQAYFEELRWNIEQSKITEQQALDFFHEAKQSAGVKNNAIPSAKGTINKATGEKIPPTPERLKEVDDKREAFAKSRWTSLDEVERVLGSLSFKLRGSGFFKTTLNENAKRGVHIAAGIMGKQELVSAGMPDVAKMVELMEEPSFTNLPLGTIVGIVQVDPDQKVQTAVQMGVTPHKSYPYVVRGKRVGVFKKEHHIEDFIPLKPKSSRIMEGEAMAATISFSISPVTPAQDMGPLRERDLSTDWLSYPTPKGELTKAKIIKYLKDVRNKPVSRKRLAKFVMSYDNAQDLLDHTYYHGTSNFISSTVKPSITLSDRDAERMGGGGYGEKYWAISLSKSKRVAESFSGQSRGVSIHPVLLKKSAKIISIEGVTDAADIEDHILDLWKNQVDAVWIGGGEEELAVINPKALVFAQDSDYYAVFGGYKSENFTLDKAEEVRRQAQSIIDNYSDESPQKLGFSISPIRNLNELSDQVERNFAENPVGALEVKSKVIRQFAKLADKWSNERWTPQGNKIRPISEKRTVKSLDKEQAMRQATLEGEKIAANMDAGQAQQQAKTEAQAWRTETDAMQKEDWSPRESLVRDLITLEAIVAMFPAEIRGKIGGFVALARKASESARLKVLQKQLERGQVLLEKHLKDQYGEATEKMLKRFKSQKDASGRITGKIISTATEQVDYAAEFINLSIEEQADRQAALEKKIEESDNADEVQDALTKLGIARLFDMYSDKDSASRESAFTWLNETIEAGKLGKSIVDEARKEMLTEMRQSAQSSILAGDELNPDVADNITNLNKGVFKRALLNLRGMLSEALWTTIQRLELIFGEDSKILNHFAEKIINAANLSTDIKRLVEAQKKDALSIIFNSDSKYAHARGIAELQKIKQSGISTRRVKKEKIKLDLETLTKLNDGTMSAETAGLEQYEVDAALEEFAANARKSTVTIEKVVNAGTPVERMMSETQGIQWWLWSMQDASRKQMERDGWDADSFKQLEEFLSPEAKALGRWISGSYQDAAGMIDPIYRKLFNAPLPRTKNYSPIHRRNMNTGGDIMDIDGSDMNSGLAAGFVKARVNTTASLVEMDALAVFLAHWENVSHWVSHAELMRDMKAILLDKDTAVAIRQKKSEGYLQRLKEDVKTIEKNGTNSASELVNISRVWRWFMQYRSYKGLAFRLSPIIKQTPALLNPLLADVPAHNYMMGMARAFIEPQTFAKEVSAMWTSDIIRRRIEAGFSAESRVAMQGAGMTGSQVIVAMQAGMMPMGMVDGGWTALGAAISFDYYRRGYMRDNPQMTPEIADSKAIARVEKMIATSAQPSDVYARSLSERSGNPFMKSMSMFVSDQRKALAIELMAIRRLATGKSTNKTLDIQRAFVAHFVQAGVSQVMAVVIASLLGDDEDRDRELSREQWTLALALGPINGLFVFGRLADKIGRGLLGLRVFPADDLASKVANDLLKGGKNMDELFNPDDADDFMDALDSSSTALGAGMSAAIGPAGGAVDVGANLLREARKIQKRLSE